MPPKIQSTLITATETTSYSSSTSVPATSTISHSGSSPVPSMLTAAGSSFFGASETKSEAKLPAALLASTEAAVTYKFLSETKESVSKVWIIDGITLSHASFCYKEGLSQLHGKRFSIVERVIRHFPKTKELLKQCTSTEQLFTYVDDIQRTLRTLPDPETSLRDLVAVEKLLKTLPDALKDSLKPEQLLRNLPIARESASAFPEADRITRILDLIEQIVKSIPYGDKLLQRVYEMERIFNTFPQVKTFLNDHLPEGELVRDLSGAEKLLKTSLFYWEEVYKLAPYQRGLKGHLEMNKFRLGSILLEQGLQEKDCVAKLNKLQEAEKYLIQAKQIFEMPPEEGITGPKCNAELAKCQREIEIAKASLQLKSPTLKM